MAWIFIETGYIDFLNIYQIEFNPKLIFDDCGDTSIELNSYDDQ